MYVQMYIQILYIEIVWNIKEFFFYFIINIYFYFR